MSRAHILVLVIILIVVRSFTAEVRWALMLVWCAILQEN
jgi:hypothetical protein